MKKTILLVILIFQGPKFWAQRPTGKEGGITLPATPSGKDSSGLFAFFPGETVLFEENFKTEYGNPFSQRWKSWSGTGSVKNGKDGIYYECTEDSGGVLNRISPAVKTLDGEEKMFTLEMEVFVPDKGARVKIFLPGPSGKEGFIQVSGDGTLEFGGFQKAPGPQKVHTLKGRWVTLCLAYKNRAMRIFADTLSPILIEDLGYGPAQIVAGFSKGSRFRDFKLSGGGNGKILDALSRRETLTTYALRMNENGEGLKTGSHGFLNALGVWLASHPKINLGVDVHTEGTGDREERIKQSVQKGNLIREHLIKMGIPPERIKITGKGGAKPIDSDETEEGRSVNRRVEIFQL